ncbi:protein FAR-RED IMPAIRED RESPONSE 1-like [Citrus sinensis]|uniref:protein FAR-RED IMPAIRED RESPONSE 1-like n=1 Tax=Citrus sinensis TaxID=2711 RepID=UPI0007636543|nr:protein FAR-RED IMPAIRED RESPONSE 1-like [Citrus sinensis]XP_024041954.1 protein FAR-RED IMPAIRED RESPONSE 1-like [Citrus x clementina]
MAQSFKSIVVEVGGYENVSFLEKDARNHVDKARRLRLGEGDATAIQKYFQKMQAENDGFFFSLDLDEEGRLNNVFWADPRSRAAYKDFGDVVTFDTTYLTNKYDMPFAPFIGVNHHGHSILLGCWLISHEDTETFMWLFDTWLSCIFGSPSLGIITYQYRAMKNAIEIVFPNTRHQWCLWHILKKVSEKLGRGIVCRHVIAVLIRNHITFLPEKYIIWRWRKYVQRCYSQVKVSYDVRSSSIEHQRYKEECAAFYDVADVASKNEESHKSVLTWIEKAIKDVSLNVRCQSEDATVVGGSRSCTEIIQDPIISRRKGRPPSQRKQK